MIRARLVASACAAAGLLALGAPAGARPAEDFAGATVIYARDGVLYRATPRGKDEAQIATLPDRAPVRALRTDAAGKILLIDVGGAWSYLPLDGSTTTPKPLPCAAGPAMLDEDATCVLCRTARGTAQIVNLTQSKAYPLPIPMHGARIAGVLPHHRLVWIDHGSVWTAPPGAPGQTTKAAPQAPVRDFLASPDGSRAIGVYDTEIYVNARRKQPGQALMGFRLDGEAARRMAIRTGVPVQWSHDSQWVLVQDGGSACLMRAIGGEYKCWQGFTAASIASDGRYALVFGRHRAPDKAEKSKKSKKSGKSKKHAPRVERAGVTPAREDDEHADEAPAAPVAPATPLDDLLVAPPAGPVTLYLARLEGSAFVQPPTLVARSVDGAAVWVPAPAGSSAAAPP